MLTFGWILLTLVYMAILCSHRSSIAVWTISLGIGCGLLWQYAHIGWFSKSLMVLLLSGCLLFAITPFRRRCIARWIMRAIGGKMPVMSNTEREALAAGTVGFEGSILCGAPDFAGLLAQSQPTLTPEEEAFLQGPVHILCQMLDDWKITHQLTDLPQEVWTFIKEHGFLGMIIPKQYGGLEFSAVAQMSVLIKLYSCSVSVGTTVCVPNSLGPAELLLKYGTTAQKNLYLPRLAKGLEIPCFALTSAQAGSDAAAMPDKGVVCYQEINGAKVLGMSLTWDKRYITLCPVATVIGLAFRLYDPENILGKGKDVGICCALIPADTPGVVKGRRHFPLNVAFLNGPTHGKNVFVPIDCLIGGAAMAGQGWRMLMECLSVGRAISLPSSAAGGLQAIALASGAYAKIRKQFNQSIAKFEGIEEALARVVANTYMVNAAVSMTAQVIDHGGKPSVAGAILKYHSTERARKSVMDAMDIHGGKGICLGPNNYLGRGYQFAPISITVEGANILSRSLIIFGQGAIRCHPYAFDLMESVKACDLAAFDTALWGHLAFFASNIVKSCGYALTDARLISTTKPQLQRYHQLITRYSNHLACLTDVCMMLLGGELKRKETLSARLGDMLSSLYFAMAAIKRFHDEGSASSDLPIVEWCCQQLLYECEMAMVGVIDNFPVRWARRWLRLMLTPFGHKRRQPSDALGKKLAQISASPCDSRKRLGNLAFLQASANCPLGRLEEAFQQCCAVEDLEKKVMLAVKQGLVQGLTFVEQVAAAKQQDILNAQEYEQLMQAEVLRQDVIQVDDFSDDELRRRNPSHVPADVIHPKRACDLSCD